MQSRSAAQQAEIIVELAERIADGTIRTPIAATYPLERWREAIDHAARSGPARAGKVIFTP